jgi:hypothetical protein
MTGGGYFPLPTLWLPECLDLIVDGNPTAEKGKE